MTVRRGVVPVLIAALVAALSLLPLIASPATAAAMPGYIRLAHLSPDTPKVDVWVTSFRGGKYSTMLPSVGYGALSAYQRVSPGTYTVAMRAPGASKKSTPILSTNVIVASGKAYTVAGVGRNANITLKVLTDDLSRPDPGKARMRVVQASSVAPVVNVTTTTGKTIAMNVTFPSTTDYAEVPAQRWTLKAKPQAAGVRPAEQAVQVNAGSIYTVLVLDKGTKAVQLTVRTDAAGSATMPVGSVDTGLGGMARTDAPWLPRGVLPVTVVVALLLSGLAWTRRRARA
jgi:Domain of unknown function (DUF4397)